MEQNKEYFIVNMHGQYFAETGDRKELRAYTATFRLPDASQPLGIIVGQLLMPFLKNKDPQASAPYTHIIDEIIPPTGKPFDPDDIPPRFQTEDQLKLHIRRHKLPINVDEYGSIGQLREHVRMAQEEPENFLAMSAEHRMKAKKLRELTELNKNFAAGEAGISLAPVDGGGAGVEVKAKPSPAVTDPNTIDKTLKDNDKTPEKKEEVILTKDFLE